MGFNPETYDFADNIHIADALGAAVKAFQDDSTPGTFIPCRDEAEARMIMQRMYFHRRALRAQADTPAITEEANDMYDLMFSVIKSSTHGWGVKVRKRPGPLRMINIGTGEPLQ